MQRLWPLLQRFALSKWVVAFWDPDAILRTPCRPTPERSILEVQAALEQTTGAEWGKQIDNSEAALIRHFPAGATRHGNLQMLRLASVTNFSCPIVDDNVFFFPF
ncbi:unnamed protein product [Gemmata massiliana]|uniref:Uncharacterized protein n=1 Tax=Gemmata massiliana TaxID=1210884 RepID=A0A6P2D3I5_9BACT|nr:unnamed protein product [Gemmata massiliana]